MQDSWNRAQIFTHHHFGGDTFRRRTRQPESKKLAKGQSLLVEFGQVIHEWNSSLQKASSPDLCDPFPAPGLKRTFPYCDFDTPVLKTASEAAKRNGLHRNQHFSREKCTFFYDAT
jgi:hypothetical protein